MTVPGRTRRPQHPLRPFSTLGDQACALRSMNRAQRRHQVETNKTDAFDFSKIEAATSPKNNVAPGRRLTPMTMRLYRPPPAFFRITFSAASAAHIVVRIAVL